MEIFHRTPSSPKTKILYLGGATWKIKSMFDIDINSDSFCDLLIKNNIEVFSFDLPETSHIDLVNTAQILIEQHSIDYVMGYSYGCISSVELALTNDLKGVILLDPYQTNFKRIPAIDTGKTLRFKVQDVKNIVDEVTVMNDEVKQAYLTSLSDTEEFVVPRYPKTLVTNQNFLNLSAWTEIRFVKCPIYTVFSAVATQAVKNYLHMFDHKTYKDNSHWILLEDARFDLADTVVKFIDYIENKNVI